MFIFPAHLFCPNSVTAQVVGRVISGGVSLSGIEDVIATDGGGRVRVDFADISLSGPVEQRAWSAWTGHLGGGAVECLVPVVSIDTAPLPWAGRGLRPVSEFGGNDPVFPTSVGYRVPLIAARTVGASALRATQITIRMSKGSPLVGGEWFSIGQRAHRIIRIVSRSGTSATVRIEPPLRAAVPSNTVVEFEWPVMRARLAPDSNPAATIQLGSYSETAISFVEAI